MEKIDKEVRKHLQKTVGKFNPTVGFEQVWNKYSYKKSENKKASIRPRLTYIITAALLLLVMVPVSATIGPFEWNGINISITNDDDKGEKSSIEKELLSSASPTYKELVENITTNKNETLKETLNLKEAQKEFPFPILRPEETLTPKISIGTINDVVLLGDDVKEKVSGDKLAFHDFYEKENKWAVVTQFLDQAPESISFVGEWENVKMSDNKLAMFIEAEKMNVLYLNYKLDDDKVILIYTRGNQSKEELLKLADAYNIHK